MEANRDLERLVAEENAREHDACAVHHDVNVPYVGRPQTRAFYWELIQNSLKDAKCSFKEASVCELGCGTGTFLNLALDNGGKEYWGVDISPRMIERAQAKTTDPRAHFVVDTLAGFSQQHEGAFDIILSSSFLHHLVDLGEGVEQIKKLLRPGGVYVALHEPIMPRQQSKTEMLDLFMQILTGQRFGELNLMKRLALAACGYWKVNNWDKPTPFFDLLGWYAKLKGHESKQEGEMNLVDYQLNSPFALSKHLAGHGTVTPYTYLCFKEVFRTAVLNNYEMLVITK
ncbi:MAG: class I SAM-dependent methyltransferase [Chlamydiales bacterium]|nr:class I SAM-dependent methyltransferase [Chlamydiales bacterium]